MIADRFNGRFLVALSLTLFAAGCEKTTEPNEAAPGAGGTATLARRSAIAVSSPYLEVAVREVACRDVPMERLAGPSMCPGHFDMRPSQISELARCGLLVRFDFQQALDQRLADRRENACHVAAIAAPGGLCLPDTYVSICRQVAESLVRPALLTRSEADARLAKLAERMVSLRRDVTRQIEAVRLRDCPVLTSGHQADFCRWLGLRVVAEISSADSSRFLDLDEAIKAGEAAGVRLVVANEPEGRRAADAVADRLRAQVVVFANFPDPDKEPAFDDLVRRNVAALLALDPLREKRP
jgi:zinc transport system substrate-binding protein